MKKIDTDKEKINLYMIRINILSKKSNIVYWLLLIFIIGFISIHDTYQNYIFQELTKLKQLSKNSTEIVRIDDFKKEIDKPTIYILSIGIVFSLVAVLYLFLLWIEIIINEKKIEKLRKNIFRRLEKRHKA